MDSNDFIVWLKGYVAGCDGNLNLETIKKELDDVHLVKCPQSTQIGYPTQTYPYSIPCSTPTTNPNWIGDPPTTNPFFYTTGTSNGINPSNTTGAYSVNKTF